MVFFFFKQKTAYEMRISDWSSDVCSSDLLYRAENSSWSSVKRVIKLARSFSDMSRCFSVKGNIYVIDWLDGGIGDLLDLLWSITDKCIYKYRIFALTLKQEKKSNETILQFREQISKERRVGQENIRTC